MKDDSARKKNSVRQFIDTNVLVYAHDLSAGTKHHKAKALLTDLWHSRMGCLSIQVLQEFYVTMTQKVKIPMKSADAARIISDLGQWVPHEPDVADILDSIDIQQRFHLSFWDALIVHSAIAMGCKTIWSEDLNHGQIYGGVRVLNPFLTI